MIRAGGYGSVRSRRKVLVGKFGLWIGWLYLNIPFLFIEYLMYTFSIDLIISVVVFILDTKFGDI